MLDDRLEIWSHGKLPPPITLERLGYDQLSRNKVIARVLVELGYIEEVGLGIRRDARVSACRSQSFASGSSFVITFRSIAPREGVAVHMIGPSTTFIRLAFVERGETVEGILW